MIGHGPLLSRTAAVMLSHMCSRLSASPWSHLYATVGCPDGRLQKEVWQGHVPNVWPVG